MIVGNLVKIQDAQNKERFILVIKELTFKEYCNKLDNLMLEYDADDAWSSWQTRGPCYEVLDADGDLLVVWKEDFCEKNPPYSVKKRR